MFDFICNLGSKCVNDILYDKEYWDETFNNFNNEIISCINKDKIIIVVYDAFLPPFYMNLFNHMKNKFLKYNSIFSITISYDENDIKKIFQNYINKKFIGIILVNKLLLHSIQNKSWFFYVEDYIEIYQTIKDLNIDVNSFCNNELFISLGFQGLDDEIESIIYQMDFSQLLFLLYLFGSCHQLNIFNIGISDLTFLLEFITSFEKYKNTAFPNYEAVKSISHNEKLGKLLFSSYNINSNILSLLKYQNLITVDDYYSFKILKQISKYGDIDIYSINNLLPKNFTKHYVEYKDLIMNVNSSISWLLARIVIESYITKINEPFIMDHNFNYSYWNSYPIDEEEQLKFENCLYNISNSFKLDLQKSNLSNIGVSLINKSISLVFMSDIYLERNLYYERELLNSIVNEIISEYFNRIKYSNNTKDTIINSMIIKKLIEIIVVLNITTDISFGKNIIHNELNNENSSWIIQFFEYLTNLESDHIISTELDNYIESIKILCNTYPIYEKFYISLKNLLESNHVYQSITDTQVNKDGIISFIKIWSKNLRRDIAKEKRGITINNKKWNILSKKYNELSNLLINLIQAEKTNFNYINNTWADAENHLSTKHVIFVIIVDSMSLVDWFCIKQNLVLDNIRITEDFALSTIPTETPVGHGSIFSGLVPSENGIISRVMIDKNNNVLEIFLTDHEDDTPIRTKRGRSETDLIRFLVNSNNINKRCTIITPFKGTKLSTIIKIMVDDNSNFIEDIGYKEDRSFETINRWIVNKIFDMDESDLINNIIFIQFPNIDKRGHKGEWGDEIYFMKMDEEINKIINSIKKISEEKNIKIGMLFTSDHGKILRWEVNKIKNAYKRILSFNDIKKHFNRIIRKYSHRYEPIKSAKYIMCNIINNLDDFIDELKISIDKEYNENIFTNDHYRIFKGSEVIKVLGNSTNNNIIYPNLFITSLYDYSGPGNMQHSGLSLGELIVPYIYLEVNSYE